MTKLVNRLAVVSGWAALVLGIIGPWGQCWSAGFGIGCGLISIVTTELYFEIRWREIRWGGLKALAVTVLIAIVEIAYILVIAAFLQGKLY